MKKTEKEYYLELFRKASFIALCIAQEDWGRASVQAENISRLYEKAASSLGIYNRVIADSIEYLLLFSIDNAGGRCFSPYALRKYITELMRELEYLAFAGDTSCR